MSFFESIGAFLGFEPEEPDLNTVDFTVEESTQESRPDLVYGYGVARAKDTHYFSQVDGPLYTVSSACYGEIENILKIRQDGEDIRVSHTNKTLVIGGENTNLHAGFSEANEYIKVNYQNGTENQQIDFSANSGGRGLYQLDDLSDYLNADKWDMVNANYAGTAWVAIKRTYKEGVVEKSGEIDLIVQGVRVFDPRDVTQDFNDRSTWKWSNNPAICILDYVTNPLYGMGVPYNDANINITKFIEAADHFDIEQESGIASDVTTFKDITDAITNYNDPAKVNEIVLHSTSKLELVVGVKYRFQGLDYGQDIIGTVSTLGGYGSRVTNENYYYVGIIPEGSVSVSTNQTLLDQDASTGFEVSSFAITKMATCNGTVDTSKKVGDNLKALTSCFNGSLHAPDGRIAINLVKREVGPFERYDRTNIVGDINFEPLDVGKKYNSATATYTSPAKNFEETTYATSETTFLDQDNQVDHVLNKKLPFTSNEIEARRICFYEINKSRHAGLYKFDVMWEGLANVTGDIIEVVEDELGWSEANPMLLRILKISIPDVFGDVTLVCEQYDANDILDGQLNVTTGSDYVLPPSFEEVPAPDAVTVTDAVGSKFSSMTVTWSSPTGYTPNAYRVKVTDTVSGEMVEEIRNITGNLATLNFDYVQGSTYLVEVFCVNLTGKASLVPATVTHTYQGIPSPTSLSVSVEAENTVFVDAIYSADDVFQDDLTHKWYIAEFTGTEPTQASATELSSTNIGEIKLTGLSLKKKYRIWCKPVRDAVDGSVFPVGNGAVVDVASLLGISAPSDPVLTLDVGTFGIEASVNNPVKEHNHKYELRVHTSNSFGAATSKGFGENWTLSNLAKGTQYFIWVQATNDVGSSAWAAYSPTTATDVSPIEDVIDDTSFVLPLSGVVLPAEHEIVVKGKLSDASSWFEVDAVKASVIDVTNLFAQNAEIGGTLKIGTTDPDGQGNVHPRVKLGGGNTPFIVRKKSSEIALSYDDTDGLHYEGSIGDLVINSPTQFTDELWQQIRNKAPTAGEATGGFYEYDTTSPNEIKFTTTVGADAATPEVSLTLAKSNTNSVILSVNVTDSGSYIGATNQNYTKPVYDVIFKRGTETMATKRIEGNAANFEEPMGGEYDCNFSISKTATYTDSSHGNSGGTSQTYSIQVVRVSGSFSADAEVPTFTLSQGEEGGGGVGGTTFDSATAYEWDAIQDFNFGANLKPSTNGGVALTVKSNDEARTFNVTSPVNGSQVDPFTFNTSNSWAFQTDSVTRFSIGASGLANFTAGLQIDSVNVPTVNEVPSNGGTGAYGDWPIDISGEAASASNSQSLGGKLPSQFLRSDEADTATAAINFTGGITRNSVDVLAEGDLELGLNASTFPTFSVEADYAKPQGWSGMIRSTSANLPISNHGYWHVLGRRDSGGGYAGTFTEYSSGRTWIGWSTTANAPSWHEIGLLDKSNTFTATQTHTANVVMKDTAQIDFVNSAGALDMSIRRSGENLQFIEPEESSKVHFEIKDDTGVNAPFGYWVNAVQIVNNSGTLLVNAPKAEFLTQNALVDYGRDTLQFANVVGNGGAGGDTQTLSNPTNNWHYHLVQNHGNTNGYYFDIISDFHNDKVYFKRVTAGSHGSFREFLHSGNANDFAPTLTGTGASGEWPIDISGGAESANNSSMLDNLDSSRFSQLTVEKSGSCNAGWVTVFETTSGRHAGEIWVSDGESGDHSFIHINFYRSFASVGATVLNTGGHARRITGVRWLQDDLDVTYGTTKLQVYVNASSVYKTKVQNLNQIPMYVDGTFVHPNPYNEEESANTTGIYHVTGLADNGGVMGAYRGRFGILYEQGTSLISKYLGINDKADDSASADFATNAGKLDNLDSTAFGRYATSGTWTAMQTYRAASNAGIALRLSANDGGRSSDILAPANGNVTAPFIFSTSNAWSFSVDSVTKMSIDNGGVDVFGTLTIDGNEVFSVSENDSRYDARYYTRALADARYIEQGTSVQTIDGGTNTTLNLVSADDGQSTINLYGGNQGSGRFFAGQTLSYGGGIEYHGDSTVTGAGAGDDMLALFRVSAGGQHWTARNYHSSDNWEFRAQVTATQFNGALSGNATTATTATTANNALSLGGVTAANYARKDADSTITANYYFPDGYKVEWGDQSDYIAYFDTNNMVFRGYTHGKGVYFQQEGTDGVLKTCAVFGGSTTRVTLYWNGVQRLITTSTGVDITGTMDATGAVSGSSWTSTSARKYKDVYDVHHGRESLQKVVAIGSLGVSIGKFHDGRDDNTHRWFIADDVALIMPEVVRYKDNEVEALNYQEMIPDAYAAIAEQQAIITEQDNRIRRLEMLVEDLLNGK